MYIPLGYWCNAESRVTGIGREELKKEAEMLKRELRALKKSEKEKKDKVERDEDASPTDKGNITLFFIIAFNSTKRGHTYAVD